MTRVVGSYYRDGFTAHLAPCPHLGEHAVPYAADEQSIGLHAFVIYVVDTGLQLCERCWPRPAYAYAGSLREDSALRAAAVRQAGLD